MRKTGGRESSENASLTGAGMDEGSGSVLRKAHEPARSFLP